MDSGNSHYPFLIAIDPISFPT